MLIQSVAPILFFFLSQLKGPSDINRVKDQFVVAKEISLENRYDNKFVNDVFKDNILLNIAYMSGKISNKSDINWNNIEKPFNYKFTLLPAKTFAFHDDVLPQYKDSVAITTKSNFNFQDGFKSDGYLTGDGVCHLASLIYWAAKAANLETYAPRNHDFARIPQIDREYGVAIYKMPGQTQSNELQNLYVTNNRQNPVVFEFDYDGKNLKLSILEIKSH